MSARHLGVVSGSDGDGDSTLEVDDEELPEDVSAKVGSKGATVEARGVTLDIPEGALDKEVLISAKNLGKSKPSSVKAKQTSDRYEFGPEGTKFAKAVTVSFKTEESNTKAKVYFTKERSSEFEKLATTSKGGEASAKVRHFSQGFVGIPDEEDSEQVPDAAGPDASLTLDDAGGSGNPGDDASVEPDAGIPAVEPKHIVFNVLDAAGTRTKHHWAVLQDGKNGAFRQISATNGSYAFDVENDHFAVLLEPRGGDNRFAFPELSAAPGFDTRWAVSPTTGQNEARVRARWATATSNLQDEYEVFFEGGF